MEYIITPTDKKIYLPARGYFKKGDKGIEISIISSFLAINFYGYENKLRVKVDDILGDFFGVNLEKWIKEFQRSNNLVVDGCIGAKTLEKLREYGLSL